jgi:hypothetical protein
MITILVHDKYGIEVCNGDTIRYFDIEQEYQQERGDNIPNGFYEHQVGVKLTWVQEEYHPLEESDFGDVIAVLPRNPSYDRERLEYLFNLQGCGDEEFNECIVSTLAEKTRADDIDGIIEEINGFSIVRSERDTECEHGLPMGCCAVCIGEEKSASRIGLIGE